jgi:hypothetical protein
VADEQRPDADLGENGGDDPASETQRPRLDKDLLHVSLWWLLFWLVVAVAVLWLVERVSRRLSVLRSGRRHCRPRPGKSPTGAGVFNNYATVVTLLQ